MVERRTGLNSYASQAKQQSGNRHEIKIKAFIKILSVVVILFCMVISVPALAATVQYTYDALGRLTGVEATDSTMVITYTYDKVGNRMTMTSQGIRLETPQVADLGDFSLDRTTLELNVTTYGEQYGVLGYEYAIGTSAGATDMVDWTSVEVGTDGTAVLEGLSLPYDQEYFVSVRIKNFAGNVVSGIGTSDGITILDPGADADGDGFGNESEVMAGSNMFNPDSYPGVTIVHLRPGFNLMAIPAEVEYQKNLRDWLPVLGDSSVIEKVLVHDDRTDTFITLMPGESSSEDFMLKGGEGLIVYAIRDKDITFTSMLCSTLDLRQGFNLVGFACPGDNYTAYQVLNDLGSANVESIQRYCADKGTFETAGFVTDGQPAGVDFSINPDEGYFIFMKQEALGF